MNTQTVIEKDFNIDMEIWKDIEGYEGLYQVSSDGNLIRVYGGVTISAKELNVKQSTISTVLKRGGTVKGYNIRFV